MKIAGKGEGTILSFSSKMKSAINRKSLSRGKDIKNGFSGF
jgi:hypothetical protein